MLKSRAQFTSKEVAEVLRHYELGKVVAAEHLTAGNRSAPKIVLTTEKGKYLLKRRPSGKNDILHVDFNHSIQIHLQNMGIPVAGLVNRVNSKETSLFIEDRAYEIFHFIDGHRTQGSAGETIDAGRQLAKFHEGVIQFHSEWLPSGHTYHDAGSVRGHLRMIRSNRHNRHADADLQVVADRLLIHYNRSSVAVNSLGFDIWPQQIIHADWHPGNLLFSDGHVICVLDFDSARIAPRIIDVANGALQFSIVGVRPNPADWPAYLDQAKLTQFLEGYRSVTQLEEDMLMALPDLMIEIMIAEAVLPIAATGFFGHFSGLEFLQMIQRKCDWIDQNRPLLKDAILAD